MKAIFLQKRYNVLMIQKKQISQLVLPIVLVVAVVILAILQVHFINTQYEIEVKKLRDESARKTTEVALLLEDELLFLPLLVQGAAIQDENSQMPVIDTAIHAMEFWNKNAKVDSIFQTYTFISIPLTTKQRRLPVRKINLQNKAPITICNT